MGLLDYLRPRQPPSVRDLKALADLAEQARPARAPGVIATSAGQGRVADADDLFPAKVTDLTGTGTSAAYSFAEQDVPSGGGAWADRPSGRAADKVTNPGRSGGSGTFAVGDIVLCRRSVANANEYEIVGRLGGALQTVSLGPIVTGVSFDSSTCTLTVTTKTLSLTGGDLSGSLT